MGENVNPSISSACRRRAGENGEHNNRGDLSRAVGAEVRGDGSLRYGMVETIMTIQNVQNVERAHKP